MKESEMPFDVEVELGVITLYARKGYNIEYEVIPEAVRFVKLMRDDSGIKLKNLRGLDLQINLNSDANKLVEIWKQDLYKTSGIEI